MSRNAEAHFALNPSIGIQRSRLDLSHDVKTTFNVGEIIPFTWTEVLPGDTFSVDTSKVVRLQTPIVPVMDNLYLDTYYFFVPNRLVWEHWKEFMGENTASAWAPTTTYSIPQITAPASTGWTKGSLADYFGVPTNVPGLSVNALPFRCYCAVVNDWFRDENLTDPLYWSVGDATVTGSNGTNYRTDVALGGKPFIAAKLHDYFTSALPGPLKSNTDVQIPLGTTAPVYASVNADSTALSNDPLRWNVYGSGGTTTLAGFHNIYTWGDGTNPNSAYADSGNYTLQGSALGIAPKNLVADLGNASAATINSLRLAFQIQKLLEKDARNGSRYIEIIKGHFSVTSPDARLQRPEYLGGNRLPLNILQITATAESANTDLGQTGAYSMTVDSHSDFTRSFTEHGYIIGLMVARYSHSYQQGLERMWTRKDRLDYYWPVLANIGELPIRNDQIYATGTSTDSQIFGYQEAWAEYRYKPNYVTGEMRSNVATSLDAWHFADDYAAMPVLSDAWIREDKTNVDRALMVQSSVSDQIFADIFIKNHATRPMPVFSIPGLIDHH